MGEKTMQEYWQKLHENILKFVEEIKQIFLIIRERIEEFVKVYIELDIELKPEHRYRIVRSIYAKYYYIPHFKKNMPYCRRSY